MNICSSINNSQYDRFDTVPCIFYCVSSIFIQACNLACGKVEQIKVGEKVCLRQVEKQVRQRGQRERGGLRIMRNVKRSLRVMD